jgi:hypothetical protein
MYVGAGFGAPHFLCANDSASTTVPSGRITLNERTSKSMIVVVPGLINVLRIVAKSLRTIFDQLRFFHAHIFQTAIPTYDVPY